MVAMSATDAPPGMDSTLPWHFGCNYQSWGDLVTTVERLGCAVALLILGGNADIAPGTVTSTLSAERQTLTPAVERASRQVFDEADGIVDLYGNEVSDAVARYTLDPAGSLYELHSPQTELPRLGSPKS